MKYYVECENWKQLAFDKTEAVYLMRKALNDCKTVTIERKERKNES